MMQHLRIRLRTCRLLRAREAASVKSSRFSSKRLRWYAIRPLATCAAVDVVVCRSSFYNTFPCACRTVVCHGDAPISASTVSASACPADGYDGTITTVAE
jgi:hypothetical protein